jgi:diguanylate cyclase (GGDEF)-like protein/PAS domain S-box-containing protein
MIEPVSDAVLVGHIAHAPILECPPTTLLGEAIARMREAGRGSIIVVDADQAVGIWTVEDIVRLDFENVEVLQRPVGEVASAPVKTIRRDAAVREAAMRFRQEGFRHLLVVDAAGNRVGIVSQTDVVNNQGIEVFVHLRDVRSVTQTDFLLVPASMPTAAVIGQLRDSRNDAVVIDDQGRLGMFTTTDVLAVVLDRAFAVPVGERAHFPLLSVSPETSLFQARSLFVERHIRHLGVKEGDRLIGLLTYGEVMACVEQVYLREMQRTLVDQSGRLLLSQQALALASALAESVSWGVVITDASGAVESINPAFTAITGYARDEVVGKNLRLLRSGKHDSEFYKAMFAALAERGSWSGEIWNRRKNGDTYPEALTVTAVRGVDGGICNYVGVFANIAEQKRAQRELLSEAQGAGEDGALYRLVLDTLPIGVVVKDEAQRYLMMNDNAAALFGLDKERVRGHTDRELFPADVAEHRQREDQAVLDGLGEVVREETVEVRGGEFHVLSHKRAVELGGRRLLVVAGIDISSRRLAEQRLADERELLQLVAANAEQATVLDSICRRIESYLHGGFAAVMVVDADGRHLRCGAAPNLPASYVAAIDGIEIGPGMCSCPEAAASGEVAIASDIADDPNWLGCRDLAEQHSLRACWSMPVFAADRRILGTFAIYFRSPRVPTALDRDLVEQGTRLAAIAIERAQASAALHRMATIDMLTGLPNRQHFFDLGQRELARGLRAGRPLAAFMIDIDHFKRINDQHGHGGGDEVLRAIGKRFAASLRGADVVGRLGGEEFAVLLPETELQTAILVAERLRRTVADTPVPLTEGGACHATVSVGVAMAAAGDDLDRLLLRADKALYTAKNSGRNQVCCPT